MWSNRLASESSPYLRQHAHDPVDWYPWGEEAFARARAEERPIFLSIGYAACHWCHVMQHESFADAGVAAFLNTHFVPVKVDREERPDIDATYIEALQAIAGQAGWPATLFLLPDLRPFTGATYLPPQPRYGLPSLQQVLDRVRDTWVNHREAVERAGTQLHARLIASPEPTGGRPTIEGYRAAVRALLERHDDEHGGFGIGQKFPHTPNLELLLLGAADRLPGVAPALAQTMRAMDDGGLHDHLGGGFHRYCVDREWTVPHFEKMLYDNAQLIRVYARWASLGDHEAWRPTRDAVAWVLREMRGPDGTFFASTDADDPDGEGAFYTFTADEAGEEPVPYGIAHPNFEGRTVLSAWSGRPSRHVRERLRELRNRRPRPAIDDKRVVAWNGLLIGALAEAGRLYEFADWVEAAAKAAERVLDARGAEGLLPRVLGSDAPGVLDDQAFVADGLLDLYQARPHEAVWLEAAADLAAAAMAFADRTGGFYRSRPRPDLLVVRKDVDDGAEPSGAGRMVEVHRRLVAYGAIDRAFFDRTLGGLGGQMSAHPASTPGLWGVARAVAETPWELVIAGEPDDPRTLQLLRVWNARWRPQGVVAVVPPGSRLGERFRLLADRPPAADGPLAYACRAGACRLPVRTRAELSAILDAQPV